MYIRRKKCHLLSLFKNQRKCQRNIKNLKEKSVTIELRFNNYNHKNWLALAAFQLKLILFTVLHVDQSQSVNFTFVTALEQSNVQTAGTQPLLDDGQYLYLNKCHKMATKLLIVSIFCIIYLFIKIAILLLILLHMTRNLLSKILGPLH